MPRLLLTDEYWSKLKPIMLEAGIYDKPGLRLTVEGILYRMRIGCPWRDLPESFGPWNKDFDFLVASKGYDSEALRKQVREKEACPLIPRKFTSTIGNDDMDWELYRHRHLVENIFARLKHFRSIMTRYDKLKRNFEGMLSLACALVWLPM